MKRMKLLSVFVICGLSMSLVSFSLVNSTDNVFDAVISVLTFVLTLVLGVTTIIQSSVQMNIDRMDKIPFLIVGQTRDIDAYFTRKGGHRLERPDDGHFFLESEDGKNIRLRMRTHNFSYATKVEIVELHPQSKKIKIGRNGKILFSQDGKFLLEIPISKTDENRCIVKFAVITKSFFNYEYIQFIKLDLQLIRKGYSKVTVNKREYERQENKRSISEEEIRANIETYKSYIESHKDSNDEKVLKSVERNKQWLEQEERKLEEYANVQAKEINQKNMAFEEYIDGLYLYEVDSVATMVKTKIKNMYSLKEIDFL